MPKADPPPDIDTPDAECPLEALTSAGRASTAPPTSSTSPPASSGRADHVRIKTREIVSERPEVHPPASCRREPLTMTREMSGASEQSRADAPKIKTREVVQERISHAFGDAVPPDAKRQAVSGPPSPTTVSKAQSVFRRNRSRMLRRKEDARTPSVGQVDHIEKSFHSGPDIKTKDSYILRHPLASPEGPSRTPDLGSRMKAWYLQRRRSAKESPQVFDQGTRMKDANIHEKLSPAHRQGEREFIQEQGRKEAVKQAKLRHSKKAKASLSQISDSGTSAPRVGSDSVPFTRQPSASPPAQNRSSLTMADGQIERTITSDVRSKASKGKHAVKTAKAGIKSSHHSARWTVKTAERSAKTMQKTQAAAKAPQRAVQAARATAKAGAATVKDTGKIALSALKKAVAAARELAAAIMAGGWVVAVITLIICIVGLLVTSPFGLFFSDPGSGMTIPEAVAQLNGEFTAQIEQIKTDNPYDTLDFDENSIALVTDNWSNVLAVYSVRVSSGDGTGASILTTENLAVLRQTFWDMNQITYATETVEHEDGEDETVLHISITTKTAQQIAEEYGFTDEQKRLLEEMLKPEYQDLFQSLTGSGQGTTLTSQEVQDILSRMPDDISEERRQVVLTAYQLLGKVNYFWGGKSLVLGWDSRWGTPREVWAAGSPSTGTVRPYGLDCSGFVDWVFYNVSSGSYVIGHGGGARMQHTYCTPITWAQAQPGDLVFYPEDTHVGIVCGFDSGGNVQIIHCASGSNNVVVTGKIGFRTIARPKYYS